MARLGRLFFCKIEVTFARRTPRLVDSSCLTPFARVVLGAATAFVDAYSHEDCCNRFGTLEALSGALTEKHC